VPVEPARGVRVASVVLNGRRPARFLVDTGSSVTLVSPALAAALELREATAGGKIELQTLAGRAVGPVTRLASLRLGAVELRDVTVVVHDPGLGVDGILGNSVLGRYGVTLDAARGLLHLDVAARR
jgi:aspartyl protease family protein